MPTVKDFMDNNDNVRIKIDLTPDMDNIGICNENLYDGMLHDIPEHLQNLKVVQEGWLIGAACNSLTVIKEKEYSFEIREQLSRIVSVKAGSEKEAHKKIEDMYYSGEIALMLKTLKSMTSEDTMPEGFSRNIMTLKDNQTPLKEVMLKMCDL